MRKSTKKVDIIIIAVIILLIAGVVLLAVLPNQEQQEDSGISATKEVTVSDYNGKRIGVLTGTNYDAVTQEYFPDSECLYYSGYSDLNAALLEGKIDGFLGDEPVLRSIHNEQPEIDYIKDKVTDNQYSFAFRKNDEAEARLCAQMNEFLAKLRNNGTLDDMELIWYGNDESKKTVDMSGLDGKNGTIHVITTSTDAPFSYIKDGKNVGYDIDVVVRFCREYGYALDLGDADFSARIPAIESGKYDFTTAMNVTEERKEQVLFSDNVSGGGIALAVRASDLSYKNDISLSDFNGKRAGIVTGSFHDTVINRVFPDSAISEYNTISDLITALTSGKIDYFLNITEGAQAIIKERPELTYIDMPVEQFYIGALFPKAETSDKLRSEFDEFITRLKSDGTLDEIIEYWKSDESSGKNVDISGLDPINGTINFANNTINPPMSFISGSGFAGVEPDIMVRFCKEYGYGLNLIDVDVGGILPGIATGMYDMAMSNMVITEERKESANFSVPYNSGELVLVMPKEAVDSYKGISYSDYAGKTIGVGTGSMFDVLVENSIPNAKLMYFNTYPDMVTALETGKVEAICIDEPVIKYIMATEDHAIDYITEPIEEYNYGFAFPKTEEGRKLRDEFNGFLNRIKTDGTLLKIEDKWFSADENSHTLPEIDNFNAEHGILRLATEALNMPFVYLEENHIAGYEIDIAYRFCEEYGYGLDITDMSFDAIIPSLTSGMCDLGCSSMNITEERAESVYFSVPDYTGGAVLAVRKSDIGGTTRSVHSEQNILDSIADSFEKNFIREDRWKLILDGIGTTCFITVLSALFGSVLAFIVCMFRRTGSRLANAVSNIYVRLLQGTPIVVLLMILYYVVLGKSGLEAVWVAVIGFTLNFGAYASEIMRSGIESVDGGQREAALALGYNENQAFFKFIFPQAAVRFLPVYNGEIVSLLKSTSIVGYIAIQDLTKMSDIIRSRTYEAFFPLIATAIIYFILAWINSLILKLILKGFDKRHTSKDLRESRKKVIYGHQDFLR